MIVVVIIGVLASLAIVRYSEATRKARYSGARLWLKRIYQSLEEFYAEHGCYPPDVHRNVAPPGLVANYLDLWPNPTMDALNSIYDYENQPFDGSRGIGVTYLGRDLIHSHAYDWAYTNGFPGEILEIPDHDDLFIVIAKNVQTCQSEGAGLAR